MIVENRLKYRMVSDVNSSSSYINEINVLIYGASGFGREVAWLLEELSKVDKSYNLLAFIDDDPSKWGKKLNDIPVISIRESSERYSDAFVVGGIGNPSIRKVIIQKASESGFKFGTLIHPYAEYSTRVSVEEGTIICAGNILTTNIHIGKHVHINLDCTIGHDVIIGDYSTLAPGVHVSGWVHFGQRVYVGTGANIINGTEANPLILGDDVVIGAGACVTKSVPSQETWAGVPAKRIK
jgi:sugar O-acyltransferase (sialic acid O-acetyltransferase NeuD family)